jgi:hemoglobin/transferrin/lactoferrin receptor protein
MNIIRTSVILIMLVFSMAGAQTGSIHGLVVDAHTNETLAKANISVVGLDRGTITSQVGEFELSGIPEGQHQLKISYIGYTTLSTFVNVTAGATTNTVVELESTVLPTSGIQITSTRHVQEIEDVAMPLTILREQKIDQTLPVTLSDALHTESGISMARDGIWGTHVSIRGLSKTNIVTLIDGNRVDTATDLAAGLSMIDVNDIERIEVIKGAASALYGSGAIGGVVNIITKDGWYQDDFYFQSRFLTGYRTANTSRQARLAVYTGNGRWYLKASGFTRKADDMETPRGMLENSQYQDNNLSARMGLRLGDKHQIKINWHRYRATDVGIPGASPIFPGQADVRYPTEDRDLYSVEYVGNRLLTGMPRLSLKVYQQKILRDVENIPHIVKDMPGDPPRRMNMLRVAPGATHDTRGVELQTNWTPDDSHYLVAGIDVWRKDLDSHRSRDLRIDILNPDNGQVIRSINKTLVEEPLPDAFYQSAGVFVQDEWSLIPERLNLTLGARMDWIHIENETVVNPVYEVVDGVRNPSPPGQTLFWNASESDDHSWSGHAALLYRLTAHTDLTLTAGRSYRAPYLEERYLYVDLGNLIKLGDPDLQSEEGQFVDLGYRMHHSRIAFQANVFLNRLNNLVVDQPGEFDNRPALIKGNVGKARLTGIDLQTDLSITDQTTLYTRAAYVYGLDTRTEDPLPAIPPLNGILGIRGFLASWIGYDVYGHFFADQNRIAEGEIRTPGYGTLSAYLRTPGVSLGPVQGRLLAGVENIFDRSYRNHLATNRGLVTSEPGRNVIIQWFMEF